MNKIFDRRAYTMSVILVSLLMIVIGCKKEEDELSLSRQFAPATISRTNGETQVTLAWAASLFTLPGEVTYSIEVSENASDFSTPAYTKTTSEVSLIITDSELAIRKDYYARVKAIGTQGRDDSNWLLSDVFRITGEVLILPVREYDVTFDAISVRWKLQKTIGKIVLTPQGGSPIEVAVSQSEYESGGKVVSGLTENTSYTVEIFGTDNVSKGSNLFKTKLSYSAYNIVDLRGISGKPKILRDTIEDVPAGSVIWLKRGEVYTVDNTDVTSTRTFNKSLTIMSAPEFNPTLAKIKLTTNYNIAAASVIDSVVFKDVVLRGARAAGASFNNDYIMNLNVAGSVGKVRLENCQIGALRGVVRLQGAGGVHIDNYLINNCVIDSIREFGIVMTSTGGANYFTNTKITNSTFIKCRRFADIRNVGTNTFVVQNCTFNNLPSGGVEGAEANYFIDFNTVDCTNGVTITNCILGKTWNEGAGDFVRGVRAGTTATAYNVTNTYTLSDFKSTFSANLIPGVSTYTGSSTSVFTDPTNSVFTIKDGAFPGKASAGDPRWRQ